MSSQFSNCRICGLHFTLDEIDSHELTCLQTSQEKMDVAASVMEEDAKLVQDPLVEGNKDSNPSGVAETTENADGESQENIIVTFPSSSGQNASTSTKRQTQTIYSDSDKPRTEQTRRASSLCGYGRGRKRNLFPPTKKYRYYPVTCEYCRKRFQPNELKAHQDKRHFKKTDKVKAGRRRAMSTASRRGYDSVRSGGGTKNFTGIPRSLRNCYLCGRLYGSKSLKIHEPKCLEKWRIQNEQLPPEKRVPEPVKPQTNSLMGSEKGQYAMPEFDPALEAAFQSHLQSLIPCTHCDRTFSPDRILKHESCCIERPKSRQCVTPVGGEIPR